VIQANWKGAGEANVVNVTGNTDQLNGFEHRCVAYVVCHEECQKNHVLEFINLH